MSRSAVPPDVESEDVIDEERKVYAEAILDSIRKPLQEDLRQLLFDDTTISESAAEISRSEVGTRLSLGEIEWVLKKWKKELPQKVELDPDESREADLKRISEGIKQSVAKGAGSAQVLGPTSSAMAGRIPYKGR